MPDIYETMVGALRGHWTSNNNAYPQRFELQQGTLDALIKKRMLIIQTMNFSEREGLRTSFLGVPISVVTSENVMVAADGTRVPLA